MAKVKAMDEPSTKFTCAVEGKMTKLLIWSNVSEP